MNEDKKSKQSIYKITGMDCPECAQTIQKGISGLPEVKEATMDFISAELRVIHESESGNPNQIFETVSKLGFQAAPKEKVYHSTLIVEGMDCPDESRPIEAHLQKLAGITEIHFNLIDNKLSLTHTLSIDKIKQELKSIGFESIAESEKIEKSNDNFWKKNRNLVRVIITGMLAIGGVIWANFQEESMFPLAPLILAILLGGFSIAKKGIKEVGNLRLGINFLMAIAVIGAMILGEWPEAGMVVFLFSLANYLEIRSMERARRSIKSLMDLTPETALVKTPEGEILKQAESVHIGEILVIKPGDRIPLDAIVKEGQSSVNQAPITGESMLVDKTIGDEVFAGTINEHGSMLVKVSREYQDSTLSRIIKLVEEAQAKKAPAQAFVEKFSHYYTPAVVVLAALVAVIPPLFLAMPFELWFYRALVLLVISCPCALVISTPITIVSGLTNAARHGILIKGGRYLEEFGRIQVIAMDKTGTVTEGKARVVQILGLNGRSDMELLQLAASAESRSEHPVSKAITNRAEQEKIKLLPVDSFQALPGKGLKAKVNGGNLVIGNHALFEELNLCDESIHTKLEQIENANQTAVLVGNEKELLGILSIADSIRPQAKTTIDELHRAGIKKVVMLTGDNHRTARAIAQEIGIDEFYAELLPQDKVKAIEKIKKEYKGVAMVGDGINDAPALAAASIGVSMGSSGTNQALETADIALMKDDLSKLPYLKRLSKYAIRNIKQNISISLGLKAIFLMLAIPGLATLWMAVIADMGASLLVVFNGLRVLKFGKP